MKSLSVFWILLLTLPSCSYFSNQIETLIENNGSLNRPLKGENSANGYSENPESGFKKNTFCSEKSTFQMMSEDESIQKFHAQLKKNYFDKANDPFIVKAIMLTLIEMRRRPDLFTPYSRLQIYLKYKSKDFYFDFTPLNQNDFSSMPSLMALDHLNRQFNKGTSLQPIAKKLDQHFANSNVVSFELQQFLKDHQNELKKNEVFTSLFFKGDDVITRYDTFNTQSYKSIIEKFYQKNKQAPALYHHPDKPLFNINTNLNKNLKKQDSQSSKIECNYNLNIDKKIQFSLEEKNSVKSLPIALSENENFFVAISSANIVSPLSPSLDFPHFFKQTPSPTAAPLCNFSNAHQNINLFSINGKNPVQHFQHLISYDITHVENINELNELLKFSRHLFLNLPDRILYESKRGRKSQLNLFLSMNFPIYHVETLGNILGHVEIKNQNEAYETLIIDDRNASRLGCSE